MEKYEKGVMLQFYLLGEKDGNDMDSGFAVFNGHINNAGDRAIEDIRQIYSVEEVADLIRMKRDGIMEIYDHPPTAVTKEYVKLVTRYANEKPDSGCAPSSPTVVVNKIF